MTEREGPYPPDEPVIGLTYPPPSPQPPGTVSPFGADGRGAPSPWQQDEYEDDGYDDGAYADEPYQAEYPGEYDPYYGRDYDDGSPARQPIFYVFVALAVLLGAGVIVAIFALVNSGDDDDSPASPTQVADFNIAIVGPRAGDRLETGEDHEISLQASSTEEIVRFELYVNDRRATEVAAGTPTSGGIYNAVLKTRFATRGEYVLYARVFSESGASKDSAKVTITAFEALGETPTTLVKGIVVATVTAREGPGDTFEEAGTLEAGDEVDITGKSRNGAWLLVTFNGKQIWVLRQAIQEQTSLALVPVREVTPTPQATPTPGETPTPSATPTDDETAPDFVPVDARFVFSGGGSTSLRITVRNDGASYEGALTIGVATTPGGLVSGQQAFGISINTGGTTTVDFEVSGTLPTAADVSVRVDPGNDIQETSEDNNQTNFQGVVAPAEPPSLEIASAQRGPGGTVVVVVENRGGPLAAGNAVGVKVESQIAATELAEPLATGGTLTFTVGAPPAATVVQVLINGEGVSSAALPAAEEPTPTATPTSE